MFVFNVRIEGGVGQVSLAADADVVSLHGVISSSALASGDELFLAFVGSLLILRQVHCKRINYE